MILGGGLDRGTTTLVMGPAGTGKSALASQYASAAAARGEKTLYLIFEESRETLFARSRALGSLCPSRSRRAASSCFR